MGKDSFFLLLFSILLSWLGTSRAVITCQVGTCDWTDPAECLDDSITVYGCKNPSQDGCMVATRSLNSSNPWDEHSQDQLHQCRCSAGDSTCDPNNESAAPTQCQSTGSTIILTSNDGNVIQIAYAAIWKCDDSTIIECPEYRSGNNEVSISPRLSVPSTNNCRTKLLPNTFSLIRNWCQNKPSCTINMELIMSYVYTETGPMPPLPPAILEWRQHDVELGTLQCSANQYALGDSCYRVTERGITWGEARRFCLELGGDLARFSNTTDFHEILYALDPEGTGINTGTVSPIWLKWYTWTGEQRTVQHYGEFVEGFYCSIIQPEYQDGRNPNTYCSGGRPPRHIRGLCVLPPSDEMKRDYRTSICPAGCTTLYNQVLCFGSTPADTVAAEPCPPSYNGTMYRACSIDGQWAAKPDITNCTTTDLQIEVDMSQAQLKDGVDPPTVVAHLADFIREMLLIPGDLTILDDTLVIALEAQGALLKNSTDPRWKDAQAKNFTRATTDLANEVLNNTFGFVAFDTYQRFKTADKYQKRIDETLYQMAVNLLDQIPFRLPYENIVVEVVPPQRRPDSNYVNETSTFTIDDGQQFLVLPPGYPYAVDDEITYLSYAAFLPMVRLLYGDIWIQWDEAWINQTLGGTCNEKNAMPLAGVLNTPMLGTTLGEPEVGSVQFGENGQGVKYRVKRRKSDNYTTSNEQCAYWDPTILDFSTYGCTETAINDEFIECECDHLTNFAVIMDVNGIFNIKDVEALDWITLIGTIISTVCLALALFVFFWVRNLRKDFRFHIHRNLCISLLVAEILMLSGLDAKAMNEDLCLTIAVFLHFFFLCCFGWMLVEGLYLYFLITKVFDGSGLKPWQYYLIGYGLPVVIVSITLGATNTDGYITYAFNPDNCLDNQPKYCWLNNENGAIWAFTAPVALVVMMNVVFLMVALSAAFKARRRNPTAKSSGGNNNESGPNLQWLFGAFSLNFLLGITWIYGFFFFVDDAASVAMAYIFTTLNSLQGFVIFMTLIVLNKQVRTDFRRQVISNETFQRMALWFNVEVADLSSGWSSKNGRSATVSRSHKMMKTKNTSEHASNTSSAAPDASTSHHRNE